MQALSTAFGRSASPDRPAPGRFLPAADAKPLTPGDAAIPGGDYAVVRASLNAEASNTGSSYVSLTSAVAERLAVTRLTANPLREAEKASTPTTAASAFGSNPLR